MELFDDIRAALAEGETDYHVRCTSCRYSRHVGNAPITAEVRAVKHRTTTGHAVIIWKAGERWREVAEIPGQVSLDDIPPF